MELISELPFVGGFLSSAVAFIVVLGVVVFVHEYGHYIVGRWCGIHAEVFSLGFGPRLGGWTDKRGTEWQIAALPLGGYVRFLGDADGSSRADPEHMAAMSETDRARSFHGAAIWRRSLTVAAGPFANFILSVVVFGGMAMWYGVSNNDPVIGKMTKLPGVESVLLPGDRVLSVDGKPIESFTDIYDQAEALEVAGPMTFVIMREGQEMDVIVPYPLPPLVQAVSPLSAASKADLKQGDLIAEADGRTLHSFTDLQEVVRASGGEEIELVILRGNQVLPISLTPRETEQMSPDGTVEKRLLIGISGGTLLLPSTDTPNVLSALWIGVERVIEVITMSLTGIKQIILGNLGAENLQGPLGIAQLSGESATQGIGDLIGLIAIISTAIGMLNLFPIPVLDGGHLVMFGYEAVAGRPPAETVLRIAMTVGLAMVLLLMVFATYNDLMRLALS